jgi:hypothetical protein
MSSERDFQDQRKCPNPQCGKWYPIPSGNVKPNRESDTCPHCGYTLARSRDDGLHEA